jgi:hypothetical protein
MLTSSRTGFCRGRVYVPPGALSAPCRRKESNAAGSLRTTQSAHDEPAEPRQDLDGFEEAGNSLNTPPDERFNMGKSCRLYIYRGIG